MSRPNAVLSPARARSSSRHDAVVVELSAGHAVDMAAPSPAAILRLGTRAYRRGYRAQLNPYVVARPSRFADSGRRMGANLPVRLRLAQRVKELRLQRGWSQEQLAERAGNTEKHISQVERGKTNVGIDVLASIASGLAVDVVDLFPNRSDTAGTSVCLITHQELGRIEEALRIIARVKRRRASRGR